LEALGINLGYILTFACSFGILFVVLRAWVFIPLLRQLEKRRRVIARGLEDARVAADARANAEKEANRIITEAQKRAGEVMRDATERAQKIEQETRAQAQTEVTKVREAVMAELESERNRMLSELRGQIITLAIAAAQKLIEVNLNEHRQRALLNEFFSGVKGGVVAVLDGVPADSAQRIEVTSALPLTQEERDTICAELAQKLGCETAINFRVEPSILGGLVVRVGDRVVNGSVSGRLEDLRQSLRQ
jgi:F-type H+-transporting ATPase subunit b